MIPRFKKSRFEPKPIETDYWVDLNANEFGGVYKYYDYNKQEWKLVQTITTEKEPQFVSSPAYGITTIDIETWNNKPERIEIDEQLNALREEVEDTLDNFVPSDIVTTDDLNIQLALMNRQINKKVDAEKVYTKEEVDTRIIEIANDVNDIVIYTKVSQLENDVKYVTEGDLESKLPEDIVSDANYVHTDNNFTTALKDKLTNLDPEASKYNDAPVKLNAADIRTLRTDVDMIDQTTYKKAELDQLFTQFIRKTHRTYGFCDERPTDDLTIEDTGFVFFDYTVNEPIIWVTNEWRLLMTNKVLDGIHGITSADKQEEGALGIWDYITLSDYRFSNITNYIGDEITANTDVLIPNIYNGYFVLTVGKGIHTYDGEIVTKPTITTSYVDYNSTGERLYVRSKSLDRDFAYSYRNIDYNKIIEDYPDLVISNILDRAAITITRQSNGSYSLAFESEKTVMNSLTLSPGIKNIKPYAFTNISLPSGAKVDLTTGIANVGNYAFANSDISEITFPLNPVELSSNAFIDCKLTKLKWSKNISTGDFLDGYGYAAFAVTKGGTQNLDLTIEEGVKAIPHYCFQYRIIANSSFTLPRSLENIGYGSFYDSLVKGTFDSRNLSHVYAWAFRDNGFTSFIGRESLKMIAPAAFYGQINYYDTLTQFVFPPKLEKLGSRGLLLPYRSCSSNVNIPGTLKVISGYCLEFYGYNLNSEYAGTHNIELQLNLGTEYISNNAFRSCCCSNQLVLPESLKAIGDYAFGHCGSFNNEELYIPKNVQWIGGICDRPFYYFRDWLLVTTETYNKYVEAESLGNAWVTFADKYTPISPSGYMRMDIKEYLEDGGVSDGYGNGCFYGFGIATMKRFTVDPENQWFTSVDGVLYSKDLKRLISVPCAMTTEDGKLYMAEGCEMMDGLALGRCSYNPTIEIRTNAGNTITYTRSSPNASNDGNLRTLVLADSYKIMWGEEITEKNPYNPMQKYMNNLDYCCYFSGIEAFEVKETNPRYTSIDGIIYDKDVTTMLAVPTYKVGDVYIPDTVTSIYSVMQILFSLDDIWELEYVKTVTKKTTSYNSPVGLHIHIPASVVDITPMALYELSALNLMDDTSKMYCSVDIDENNPKYKIDPVSKYVVEK